MTDKCVIDLNKIKKVYFDQHGGLEGVDVEDDLRYIIHFKVPQSDAEILWMRHQGIRMIDANSAKIIVEHLQSSEDENTNEK